MNKCPNCGRKLSPFYFKQCCPGCKANLLYFDMSAQLEKDKARAEHEFSAVSRLLNGIKISTIGCVWGVFRIIAEILQICLLFIPVYYMNSSEAVGSLSALSLIKAVINPPGGMSAGSFITEYVLNSRALLLAVAAFILVILFAVICALGQLFSYTKNGKRRNFCVSAVQTAVFLALSIAAAANGAILAGGFYAEIALMVVSLVVIFPLDKAIKKHACAESAKPAAQAQAAAPK
ncbi:MAG: hypothetical protein LUH82_02640 [Clostridiales bacterium]|nr:hypothetical protein [Clostridiales bacterium]